MYERLGDLAEAEPVYNDAYHIYQFFARDPEGRRLEFQFFDHELPPFLAGDELLLRRRSVRRFQPRDVSDATINRVIELSRWAPTARNTQCYYFKVIRDRAALDWLAGWRGKSSAPIGRAPVAVAIGADPALSKRHIQDGCIAAYHFLLAARLFGLGTCWIAAADDDSVKARLGVPAEHYLVTVTPLGWPESFTVIAPERRERNWFTRG
jgi:nitroreductase